MHPVIIRLDADSTEMHLIDREQWDGPTIHSLRELLTMVTVECELNKKSEVIENS
jgi:hypothetical protein